MNKASFLKTFLKDVKVGAVVPTSSFAVRSLCKRLDPAKARVVVEYGPGTGVFSHFLLDTIPDLSKLILIDTNSDFCEVLRCIDDPRVHVFEDSAENVRDILKQCGEDSADYVISGIPFTLIEDKIKKNILEGTRSVLSEGGKFLVYQYSRYMRRHLAQHFGRVTVDLAMFNVPPIFIMEASD